MMEGIPESAADFASCPDSRIGFFVACNIMDGSLLDEVSRKLLDLFIPDPPQDSTKYPLTPLPQYDRNIAEFAGTYRLSRYSHNHVEKVGVLIGMAGPEMNIGRNEEGMILMNTFSWQAAPDGADPALLVRVDRRQILVRIPAGCVRNRLLTCSRTAIPLLRNSPGMRRRRFQRSLLGVCLLFFVFVSIVLPIIRKIRKTRKPSGLGVDPVRWFSQKTASTFLIYFLGLGIVMGFVSSARGIGDGICSRDALDGVCRANHCDSGDPVSGGTARVIVLAVYYET